MHKGWQTAIPSRFIKEIPNKHMIHINPNGAEVNRLGGTSSRTPIADFRNFKDIYEKPVSFHTFEIGDRIFHQKFGYGEVIEIDGDKLNIEFDHSGNKKIIADFVNKA